MRRFFPSAIAFLCLGVAGALAQTSSPSTITAYGLRLDTGTKTATATAGAATLNKAAGKVTSEALTTAAGANYTLTISNSAIAAADQVLASVANGTSSAGAPVVSRVTPGAGTVAIVVRNVDASAAFNGTLVLSFLVVKN